MRLVLVGLCTALLIGCDEGAVPVALETASSAQPTAAPGQTLFEFAQQRTGLLFNHANGATGAFHFPEIVAPGVALFDFDNDGDLDVYLVQSHDLDAHPSQHPRNQLFRNELVETGNLAFTDVSAGSGLDHAGYGMGVAVGDFNNDGLADVFLTNYGEDRLYRNDGAGRFSDVTPLTEIQGSRWSASASFFDYDADGDLDLFAALYVAYDHRSNTRCVTSTGTGALEYCGPTAVPNLPDRLWRNDGAGRFVDVSRSTGVGAIAGPGLGTVAADFNGDGLSDVYVANDQIANRLWTRTPDGRFVDQALMSGTAYDFSGATEASMGVTVGDVDGDGDEDIFMTHLNGESNTLYINDGGGVFHDDTTRWRLSNPSLTRTGWGTRFFDYDNDGLLDLYIANGAVIVESGDGVDPAFPYDQPNQLFRNTSDGFDEVTHLAWQTPKPFGSSRGAAFGDIDNDGDIDIVVTDCGGPARLLLNRVGNRNNWLRVKAHGEQLSRDATGARVALLRADQAPLWRRVHTDGSYLSASDARVHFGLGQTSDPVSVGIIWPSGLRERWDDLAINAQHELTEGTGTQWSSAN